MLSVDQVAALLLDRIDRPHPTSAMQVEDSVLEEAATRIGYPIYDAQPYLDAQVRLLPYVGSMISWLLREVEGSETHYYVFARDGLLLYDTLWGVGQNTNTDLSERLSIVKASMYMVNPNKEYFWGLGLTEQNLRNGYRPIFLDSGFWGSMFNDVLRWSLGCWPGHESVRGFLVAREENSPYEQLGFAHEVGSEETASLEKTLHKLLGPKLNDEDFPVPITYPICVFMQLMPKFTECYTNTYQNGNVWDAMPQKREYPNHGKSIKGKHLFDVNGSVVDPVASLKLQRQALEYFSSPEIVDKMLS